MFKSLITSVIVSLVTFSTASAKMSLEEKEFKAINAFVAMQIYLAKTDQALQQDIYQIIHHAFHGKNMKHAIISLSCPIMAN